jgi:excisionase family DNA binding protein
MIGPADETRLRLLLSRDDASHALGIGTTTLDELIACGSLPAIRIGRRVLIHADDVSSFASAARRDGPI